MGLFSGDADPVAAAGTVGVPGVRTALVAGQGAVVPVAIVVAPEAGNAASLAPDPAVARTNGPVTGPGQRTASLAADGRGHEANDHIHGVSDHETSDHGHETNDLGREINDLGREINDLGHEINDLGHEINDLGHETSDLGQMTSDHTPVTNHHRSRKRRNRKT